MADDEELPPLTMKELKRKQSDEIARLTAAYLAAGKTIVKHDVYNRAIMESDDAESNA
jgi:hypothetical protein